jgi:hypothetical protein
MSLPLFILEAAENEQIFKTLFEDGTIEWLGLSFFTKEENSVILRCFKDTQKLLNNPAKPINSTPTLHTITSTEESRKAFDKLYKNYHEEIEKLGVERETYDEEKEKKRGQLKELEKQRAEVRASIEVLQKDLENKRLKTKEMNRIIDSVLCKSSVERRLVNASMNRDSF